jgi:hypothetical protein
MWSPVLQSDGSLRSEYLFHTSEDSFPGFERATDVSPAQRKGCPHFPMKFVMRKRLRRGVWWWVEGEFGATTDVALRSAGADLEVTQLLMARPLNGADADDWLVGEDPPGVEARVVDDERAFQALIDVETAG